MERNLKAGVGLGEREHTQFLTLRQKH